MSTPTHLATLEDIEDALGWLREVITGLPVEALDWVPAPGANSITVLARHSLPSTTFWVRAGSGQKPSHRAYVETHRAAAFEARGLPASELIALLDETGRVVEATLRGGTAEHLTAAHAHDDEPGEPAIRGASCLVHAAAHLREHAGQAALTRDIWLAQAAKQAV